MDTGNSHPAIHQSNLDDHRPHADDRYPITEWKDEHHACAEQAVRLSRDQGNKQ
jgi:hypothetical protein